LPSSLVAIRGSVLPLVLALALVPGAGAISPAATGTQDVIEELLVVGIEVEGAQRYSIRQLKATLGQAVGQPLDRDAIRKGIEALWSTFRVRADVDYRREGSGVALLLRVVEMRFDLEPRFVGNVEIAEAEILEWAGMDEESEFYLHQAPRVRERLIAAYHREGFAFVEVRVIERDGGEEGSARPDMIFEILEGPQVLVESVDLVGSDAFPDRGALFWRSGLKKMASLDLRGPSFFGLSTRKFDRAALERDMEAMRGVYRDMGFLDAVVEVSALEFSAERDQVRIEIMVDEGETYRVASLAIRPVASSEASAGLSPELILPESELLELCELEPGQVFEANHWRADATRLRRRFAEIGHIDHPSLPDADRFSVLKPETVYDVEQKTVAVTYRINQGRRIFLREILVSGIPHTRDHVVRSRITVKPGDQADLVKISRSRSRIQGTGLFSDRLSPQTHREPTFRFLETPDPEWKDLEFLVQEGNVIEFQIAGGVDTNSGAFGVFRLTHRNMDITNLPKSPWSVFRETYDRTAFHGAGQELGIQAAPGTEVSFYDLYFREPDVFRRYVDRVSLKLLARRRLRVYTSHVEEREEVGFELGRQVGPDSAIFAGFTTGPVLLKDLNPGGEPTLGQPSTVPDLLRDQEGESDLAAINVGFRLRTLDDRISPRNGVSFSLTSKIYDEALGSDHEFIKSEVRFDWYDEIGVEGQDLLPRVHLGFRAGASVPYGDTENVPYSERFFLGGQKLLRGFDFRGVGPNQNGFPVGGETYAVVTSEYKRPILSTVQPGTYREIDVAYAGIFMDAGILDPNEFSLDPSELRASVGVMVGLTIPFPLLFSFGFPIEEGEGDRTQSFQFSIGF